MTYALALGRWMGYPDGEELLVLGQGALLHDVGMVQINPAIVNKGGPLEAAEFEEVKRHPELGFNSLKAGGELAETALLAVRHHQERLNGKGYPDGLSGPDIDLSTRIISLVDVYDALTSRRTYRKAYRSYPALRLMRDTLGGELDERVFKGFVKLLGEL